MDGNPLYRLWGYEYKKVNKTQTYSACITKCAMVIYRASTGLQWIYDC